MWAAHLPPPNLPERIWVVGPCGAGKTTLARHLARHLGVEALHLDDIHWRPGWVEAPAQDTARHLAQVAAHPRWVIDGNYTRLRVQHAARTQLYVWLDLPLRVTFPRLVQRCLVRAWRQEIVCNGNRESLGRTLLHKDSLLLWSLTSDGPRRRVLTREFADRTHVHLRSQREADRWLADVCVSRAPAGRG